jgi:hypothetical protein
MWFYRSAVASVLGVTALFKFVAVARGERLLEGVDPVFGLSMNRLAIAAGIIELLLVIFILASTRPQSVLAAVQVFAICLLGYRFAAAFSGRMPCPCLGGGVSWWPWLALHQNEVTLSIALWLWMSSLILLLLQYRSRQELAY